MVVVVSAAEVHQQRLLLSINAHAAHVLLPRPVAVSNKLGCVLYLLSGRVTAGDVLASLPVELVYAANYTWGQGFEVSIILLMSAVSLSFPVWHPWRGPPCCAGVCGKVRMGPGL